MFSFGFAPKGWAQCNGQTMPINQNQALFALLGTTYGGNGVSTFQLPNLQGRVGVHMGTKGSSTYVVGQAAGEANHVLSANETPAHTHTFAVGAQTGPSKSPQNSTFGQPFSISPWKMFSTSSNGAAHPAMIGTTGQNLAHSNMQPYLTISFCIALAGIFPSRN